MIRILCASCKNVLTVDDAFAGGVCRCQFCGTIQTVPAHLKGLGDRPEAPAATSKKLFENKARTASVREQGAAAASGAVKARTDAQGQPTKPESGKAAASARKAGARQAPVTKAGPRPDTKARTTESRTIDEAPDAGARKKIITAAIAGALALLALLILLIRR